MEQAYRALRRLRENLYEIINSAYELTRFRGGDLKKLAEKNPGEVFREIAEFARGYLETAKGYGERRLYGKISYNTLRWRIDNLESLSESLYTGESLDPEKVYKASKIAGDILNQVEALESSRREGKSTGRNSGSLAVIVLISTLSIGILTISNTGLTPKLVTPTSINFSLAFGLLAVLIISAIMLRRKK